MKDIFSTLLGLYLIIVPGSALFLVVALFRLHENRNGNRLLALFLFFAAVEILSVFTSQLPGFSLFYDSFWNYAHLFWAPTIYFYVMFLYEKRSEFAVKDLVHGIPFFLFFALQDAAPDSAVDVAVLLQSFAYVSVMSSIIYKNSRNNNVTHDKRVWVLVLSGFCVLFLALVVLDHVTDHDFYFFFLIAVSFFIITVQFKYASGNSVFFGKKRLKQKMYKNSPLSSQMIDQYAQEIRFAMVAERLFTDAELTLESLGRHLNLPVHYVSQTINSVYKKTFSSYINSFRVEHAKELILNNEEAKTMLQIAFESGFGSKSVFNSVFKKETGLTPTQFVRKTFK